jgi:hypothetical protein
MHTVARNGSRQLCSAVLQLAVHEFDIHDAAPSVRAKRNRFCGYAVEFSKQQSVPTKSECGWLAG